MSRNEKSSILLDSYRRFNFLLREGSSDSAHDFAVLFCRVELGDCDTTSVNYIYSERTKKKLSTEEPISVEKLNDKEKTVRVRASAFNSKYNEVRLTILDWFKHFKSTDSHDGNKTEVWDSFKNEVIQPEIHDEKVQAWFDFYAFAFFYERLTKKGVNVMRSQDEINEAVKEFNRRISGFQDGMTEEFFKDGLVELLAERFDVGLSYS